ncbi:MAG: CatB-related O-acetyltransferase [Nitrosomonadales bacterium]|nr:CatB-related O-acetyltransferase [Nitrosomonadales bacterium]
MSNALFIFFRRLRSLRQRLKIAFHIFLKRGAELLHLLEVERQRGTERQYLAEILHQHQEVAVTRQHEADVLRRASENNPTCRIFSAALYDVVLGKHVAIHAGTVLSKVNIADFSFIARESTVRNADIGKYCSIGPSVQIGLDPHPTRVIVSTHPAFYSNDNLGCVTTFRENKIFDDSVPKTVLANDIWIGTNVIIPGGIHIGTGAIIAAGSVVVKDVPPYAVVGGNPAKIIRYRFSEKQIKQLIESEWWDWPIEKIRQHIEEFSDIEKFRGGVTS